MSISNNTSHPSMEHGFTWNALGILENNTMSFKKKRREKRNDNIILKHNKNGSTLEIIYQ